jgi:N-acetyl-gamma-glutamyl-phosphate reductase
MNTQQVVVVGASGYAGGELLRLIAAHPSLNLLAATAHSNAGQLITDLHPHLVEFADMKFVDTNPAACAGADVIFIALPHSESAGFISQLGDINAKVIDLGADFRLVDPSEWEKFYGSAHAGHWVYGLPELPNQRAAIASANRVANPGCYATAISLAGLPLAAEGLIDSIDVVAMSGTSGAGRTLRPDLLASEVMNNLSPYKVGGKHQHIPEIAQTLGAFGVPIGVNFTPVLAPLHRGILAVVSASLTRKPATPDIVAFLQKHYEKFYADDPFVIVMPAGHVPGVKDVAMSNRCHLTVTFDEAADKVVVMSVIDNLGKGAAGQAVQNMNLMLGLPETTGLAQTTKPAKTTASDGVAK